MTKIRAIDNNGDWTFGKGLGNYKTGLDALKQNIKTKLLEWKGDCFFNNNAGIDWNNRLSKRQQSLPLQREIKSLIVKIDGVTAVNNIDLIFDEDTRNLTLNYSMNTVYGNLTDSIQT